MWDVGIKMKVAVWANDPETFSGLADLLQSWILRDQPRAMSEVLHWTTPLDAYSALSGKEDTRYLVLFETARYAVARHVADVPPSEGLAEWAATATDVLSLYRRNRRKMLFISPQRVMASFGNAQTVLMKHLEISTPLPDGVKINMPPPPQWAQVLAAQAIVQNPAAGRLVSELDAAMLPIHELPVEPDAASAEVLGQEMLLSVLQTNKDILTNQLEELRVELKTSQEQARTDVESGQAEKDLLINQLDGLRTELKTYFVSAAELGKKLIVQDAQAQAHNQALEAADAQIASLTEMLGVMEANLHIRDDELDALRASTSWKITAPMRSIKNTLNGLGKQEDK
ncbi:MAG: hypothetical protein ACJAZ1_003054 [Yoonia sp.]|jgi:hypothetical protein